MTAKTVIPVVLGLSALAAGIYFVTRPKPGTEGTQKYPVSPGGTAPVMSPAVQQLLPSTSVTTSVIPGTAGRTPLITPQAAAMISSNPLLAPVMTARQTMSDPSGAQFNAYRLRKMYYGV